MMRQTFFALAAVAAATVCTPRAAQAQSWWRNWDFSLDGGPDAERCSDLRARSSRDLAQSTESFTLAKSAAPVTINARSHGMIYVRGADRADYNVEVCKFAIAGSRSDADQLLRSIAVTHNGGFVSATGPSERNARWQVVYFVQAPRDAALSLETGNNPVQATDVNGKLTVRAANGPLALKGCSGTIDAETENGPISMTGGSGDVHLRASNGPVSLHLADTVWNGPGLEVRTNNGPLSVSLPGGFRSWRSC